MEAREMIAIRNRIAGVLIERARRNLGVSVEICAELLGCSPSEFRRYELGEDGISLPQLETLSRFLGLPAWQLWDEEAVQNQDVTSQVVFHAEAMSLRGKSLATRFQQCRRASGLSRHALASVLGQSADVISQYERAERQIPVAELEIVAEKCGLSLADLQEPLISVNIPDQDSLDMARLNALPPDLRAFVLEPGNELYLRIAQTLGALEPEGLRQIAATILDSQG